MLAPCPAHIPGSAHTLPCPCTQGSASAGCLLDTHRVPEIALWQNSSCTGRLWAGDVSDTPTLHRQCLAVVLLLSQLWGAVRMGTTAASNIPSPNTLFVLMLALVITVNAFETPCKPQRSQGGVMLVPNNSPEQAPNLEQSVPSPWGHRGTICPVCRQREEALLR